MTVETEFDDRLDLSDLREAADRVRRELHEIIVGQEAVIRQLLAALLADGHVLIEGVPGVAKTLTARLLARTVSADFTRVQFTPDLMPSDILGTSVFNPETRAFEFKRGPIFTHFVLIDRDGRIRGYYNSDDLERIDLLAEHARDAVLRAVGIRLGRDLAVGVAVAEQHAVLGDEGHLDLLGRLPCAV